MIYLYVALILVVVLLVINLVILPQYRLKKTYEELLKLEKHGFITMIVKKKNYDFIFESEDITFLVKMVAIPSNSQVTINNKWTWRLSWGGNSKNKGRSYPNNRYLHEVVDFLKETYKKEKLTVKLILLYPQTEKILMYLNESELDIITPDKTPYGYKVISLNNLISQFGSLLNIK